MIALRCSPSYVFIFLTACSSSSNKNEGFSLHQQFTQYSEFVKDTFYINIQLPLEYKANPGKKYPTLVFVDGNFFFPMMSSMAHQYETAGLLEPAIVVGVGYKSFKTMDSLRVRDYLFPKALPSDEIVASGGGEDFYNYITKELLPRVDKEFSTDKTDRSLLGHSFGGYFVLYSLSHQTANQLDDFRNFISASPSLWYNNFYLNKLPEQLADNQKEVGLFLGVGELEDSTWSVKPLKELTSEIETRKLNALTFKSHVYNHLDHMDVAVLTFAQGLKELMPARNRE